MLVLEKIPFPHVSSLCTRKELEWLQERLAERSESRKHLDMKRWELEMWSLGQRGKEQ